MSMVLKKEEGKYLLKKNMLPFRLIVVLQRFRVSDCSGIPRFFCEDTAKSTTRSFAEGNAQESNNTQLNIQQL